MTTGFIPIIPTTVEQEGDQISLPSSGLAPGSVIVANVSGDLEVGADKDPKGNTFAAQAGISGASLTGGALIASDNGDTSQIEADGTVTINAIERQLVQIPRGEIIKAATADLTVEEVSNTVINNYGQGAIATLTLPTAAANMGFLLVIGGTGYALHVKAGANDKHYLDGTALDDGDKISLATPALGNSAAFFTFQTGVSAWDWYCNTLSGYFTDGGA